MAAHHMQIVRVHRPFVGNLQIILVFLVASETLVYLGHSH
ncbi:MAG: hypothetical protein RLZ05_1525 [Bacteroidota bacterium]|jgi:hypothetical protein